MVWGGGGTVYNKCVYVCGTIPPVFWYNYPNCAPQGTPQGALQAPHRKRSRRHQKTKHGKERNAQCIGHPPLGDPKKAGVRGYVAASDFVPFVVHREAGKRTEALIPWTSAIRPPFTTSLNSTTSITDPKEWPGIDSEVLCP